ncbi:MAG: hypothetical protein HWQ41_21775 [Nostoc sp. NOS(2021)]|uniref:hypothetical protein n=1 Tax=Nostoc sp. NOS(2021) TaxID=2815407 RepID=UPI0025D75C74|nr:hypothetical protein [Nostoc sp. NOS(2021)]MBN3897797.1 hypothetical protein [Nostoc sp. NOS(2021)]
MSSLIWLEAIACFLPDLTKSRCSRPRLKPKGFLPLSSRTFSEVFIGFQQYLYSQDMAA